MRWFSRKPAGPKRAVGAAQSGTFLLIVSVGDEDGMRTVAPALMHQLVEATKQPALGSLDRYFGGASWCPEIKTHTSLEGPSIFFAVTVVVRPGETQASMSARIRREFDTRWESAVRRLL